MKTLKQLIGEEILKIKEGWMSELSIVAQESKDINDFIVNYKKFMKDNGKDDTVDSKTKNWLTTIFKQSRTKINEGKYIVHALSIGVVNIPTGKTMYNWSIYDHSGGEVFFTGKNILFGSKDSLDIGDEFELRNNDTKRLQQKGKIIDKAPNTKEAVMAMLKKHGLDYTPVRPFQKSRLTRRPLDTSFSIKGVENFEEKIKKPSSGSHFIKNQ